MASSLNDSFEKDKEIARQLVELYRNTGEPLNRSDFEAKIKQERESRSTNQDDRKALSSKGKTFEEPLMAALAEREEANMNGAMTVALPPTKALVDAEVMLSVHHLYQRQE